MFNTIVDKFSEKFGDPRKKALQKDSLESNSNSNSNSNSINHNTKTLISLEEKSTYDAEDSNSEINLVNLLSLKDKGGNTPMLFAAFRGNIKIMEKLIELGVKYDCVNNAGLNIIHMAAQSDCSNVIVYFKEKYNFKLFENDDLNNNSLHWACSSGSKSALDYLLLYINKKNNNENIINTVNNQGQTALHITVLTTGSVSTIKKLIKKNIDINIKDNSGLSVLDLVKNNDKYKNIEKIIYEYTQKNCLGLNYHISEERAKEKGESYEQGQHLFTRRLQAQVGRGERPPHLSKHHLRLRYAGGTGAPFRRPEGRTHLHEDLQSHRGGV